ncbi:MAG: hypothetical protein AB7E95_06340 [Kiritimatiellales bacterium]
MVTGNQLQQAREIINQKGWSLRGAAKELGYTWTHFIFVLTGRRESQRLLDRIEKELPMKSEVLHEAVDFSKRTF